MPTRGKVGIFGRDKIGAQLVHQIGAVAHQSDVAACSKGKLDDGEDPAVCALRELGEETPYTAERVEKILDFFSAPGFCDEVLHLYRARNITPTSSLQPDEDELVEAELYSREQIREMLANGAFKDGKTLIALQWWLAE